MIEEWLLRFVVMCFAAMGIVAWALHITCKKGEEYIHDLKNEENGEED